MMEFLINAAIAGTITALVILLVKRLFKNVFTPKWHLLIWVVLLARLVMPVLPEGDVSIYNLLPDMGSITRIYSENEIVPAQADNGKDATGLEGVAGNQIQNTATGNGSSAAGEAVNNANGLNEAAADSGANANGATISQNAFLAGAHSLLAGAHSFLTKAIYVIEQMFRGLGIETIAFIIWRDGAILFAAFFVVSYLRMKKSLKALPEVTEGSTYIVFRQCKAKLGIENSNLKLRCGATTPMLVGMINPTVYISDGYSQDELNSVITHELCHYKNRDTLINVLCTLVLCLNWFNPIMWLCFKTIRGDIEMYCDYRAVQLLGEKKNYARVLLKTATEKNSFVFATTSMQNGEAEVSKRIKKLAYYQQPKFWVSVGAVIIAIIVAAVCLVDGSNKPAQMVYVDANNQYVMEVPDSWVKDDYQRVTEENGEMLPIQTEFYKSGTMIAAVKSEDLCSELEEMNYLEDGNFNDEDIVRLYEKAKGYTNVKAEQFFMESENAGESGAAGTASSGGAAVDIMYLVTGVNPDGTTETIALRMPGRPDALDGTSYVLWTENDRVGEKELIAAAKSISKSADPQAFRPTKVLDLGWNARGQGNQYDDIEKDVQSLTNAYFENYVNTPMPRESDIADYKINSMVPLSGVVGDVPQIADDSVFEGEKVPWEVIYPTARVYKVDYELIPENQQYFADYAGGEFEIEEATGAKHYIDALAVFVDYSDDGERNKGAFLGFLHPANLAEYGIDYSVLSMLDNWYENQVVPTALENCHIKYIGAANDVSKLAGTLPLREYWAGMELQTTTEPYSATIWADFFGTQPETNDNMVWSKLSEGGDVSKTKGMGMGEITGGERDVQLNPYILRQMQRSAAWMMSGIDNAGSISYEVQGTATETIGDYTYTLDRDSAQLTYCGQIGSTNVQILNGAYSPAMSSVRGIEFKASYGDGYSIYIYASAGNIITQNNGGSADTTYIWQPFGADGIEGAGSVDGAELADGAEVIVQAWNDENRKVAESRFSIVETQDLFYEVVR